MAANPTTLQTGFWSGGQSPQSTQSPTMQAAQQPVEFGMLTGSNACLPCVSDDSNQLCGAEVCDAAAGTIHNCAFANQMECIQAAKHARSQLMASAGPRATMDVDVTPSTYKYAIQQSLSQPSYAGAVDTLYSSIWR